MKSTWMVGTRAFAIEMKSGDTGYDDVEFTAAMSDSKGRRIQQVSSEDLSAEEKREFMIGLLRAISSLSIPDRLALPLLSNPLVVQMMP